MGNLAHWFLLALYTATVAKPASVWAASLEPGTLADWTGIIVSTLSAIFLLGTLFVSINSNKLIAKQMRANKPFMVCETVSILEEHFIDSETKYYAIKAIFNWHNYGQPPALGAKFTFRYKDTPSSPINIREILAELEAHAGQTVTNGIPQYQEVELEFQVEPTEEDRKALKNGFVSTIAIYRDSHGSSYLVEKCYELYWPSRYDELPPHNLRFRQVGPDSKEILIKNY